MQFSKLILMSAFAGALSVLGCGGGGGGQSAGDVCDACDLSELRGECESFYNLCIQDDLGGSEECVGGALARCGGEV